MLTHSRHFAAKLKSLQSADAKPAGTGPEDSALDMTQAVRRGFFEVTGRLPSAAELASLSDYANQHGLENYCRLLFNLNEFLFVE